MPTLVFDTETTGLLAPRAARISQQPDIIEFYGEFIEDEKHHHYLFNPGLKLPPSNNEDHRDTGQRLKGQTEIPGKGQRDSSNY